MFVTKTSRFTTIGFALLFAICIVGSARADQPGFTTIDIPGASSTLADGINPQGDIVGTYARNDLTGFHGYLLSKGAFTTIDVPGAIGFTQAHGINPRGDILGEYGDGTGRLHGFLLSQGASPLSTSPARPPPSPLESTPKAISSGPITT